MYKCKYQFSSFPFIKLFMLFHIKKTSSRLIFVAAAKNKRVQFIALPQEDHAWGLEESLEHNDSSRFLGERWFHELCLGYNRSCPPKKQLVSVPRRLRRKGLKYTQLSLLVESWCLNEWIEIQNQIKHFWCQSVAYRIVVECQLKVYNNNNAEYSTNHIKFRSQSNRHPLPELGLVHLH